MRPKTAKEEGNTLKSLVSTSRAKETGVNHKGSSAGKSGTLRPFLTELRLHHFPDKEEFNLDVRDSLEPGLVLGIKTKGVFEDYSEFEEALGSIQRQSNEEQAVIQKMTRLKQQGSVSTYGSMFVQISSVLNWGPELLMEYFYQGLEDAVKDKLSREERPKTLLEFIEHAVRIDNRLHEQHTEEKEKAQGEIIPYKANQKKQRQGSAKWGSSTLLGPLNTDATPQRKFKCFNCNKLGNHIAKKCPEPRRARKRAPQQRHNTTIREKSSGHYTKHWTAYYNDHVHQDARGNGCYLKPISATLAVIEELECGNDSATDHVLTTAAASFEQRQSYDMIDAIPVQVQQLVQEDIGTVANETMVFTPQATPRVNTPISEETLPTCDPILAHEQLSRWEDFLLQQHDNLFTENCGQCDWERCRQLFCAEHAVSKVSAWHDYLGPPLC